VKERIRNRALELGFDDCRFTTATAPDHAEAFQKWIGEGCHGLMGYLERNAWKRVDPQKVLHEAKTIVTLAASYDRPGIGGRASFTKNFGVIARYAQSADYHDVLAEPLKALVTEINAAAGPEIKSLWYIDTGPLLERDLAQRSGLGFIGKHTNLISRRLGNWFFISEIITTAELEPDASEKNHCGSCNRCLEACPTGAITAPFKVDARLCISYLTIELKGAIPEELRPAIGNRIYGCDDCLSACPWNRFAREGRLMAPHKRGDLEEPNLLELLKLDELGFRRKFEGTSMLRTKRRGFLRNVCVAIGNTAGREALPALERATQDSEPLIAEHARWAIQRIQHRKGSQDHSTAELT
jgi:epoxyqueuosine reductase